MDVLIKFLIIIIMPCLSLGAFLYVLYIIDSAPSVSREAVIQMCVMAAVIMAPVFLFFYHKRRKFEKAEIFAERFRSQLENGIYFSSPEWQEAYRKYREGHKLPGTSFRNMKRDLGLRHAGMIFRKYGSMLIILVPCICVTYGAIICGRNFQWHVIGIAALALLFCIGVCILYHSFGFADRWFASHPEYADIKDSVCQSYGNGVMFECAHFCLVIGKKYVHGFDGKNFYTVPRENVRRCSWIVECTRVFHRGKFFEYYDYDEYMFSICFSLGGADAGKDFSIPLDQFQIKTVMDRFFPDVSVDVWPEFITNRVYSILRFSSGNRVSAPVPVLANGLSAPCAVISEDISEDG